MDISHSERKKNHCHIIFTTATAAPSCQSFISQRSLVFLSPVFKRLFHPLLQSFFFFYRTSESKCCPVRLHYMAPTRVKGSVHTKEHFLSSFGLTWGRFETSVREFCLHPRHAVGLMEFRVWCSQHGGGEKVLVKNVIFISDYFAFKKNTV